MITAWFDSPIGGESEVFIMREGKCEIGISTREPLTDEQVRDLHRIIQIMTKTGKTIREIVKDWK